MVGGRASGIALVTQQPINFTASFSKPINVIPGRRSEVQDRHHELFRSDVKGKALVFPAAIGSTYTGLMLLEILERGQGPAALIVQHADPLLVSGSTLAEVWLSKVVPIVEYPGADLFSTIRTGDELEVDGSTGEIIVREPHPLDNNWKE